MIELQKRDKSSFQALEAEISELKKFDDLVNFYKDFIRQYLKLDGLYSFTESFNEDFIIKQLEQKLLRFGALYCIPFGIKDIFNTKTLPTSMGSEIWKNFKAGNNARVVDDIAEEGGIIFSKTTTAEFAVHFITPELTINPYNSKHITGTSSSGSAVSVACGALPISIGTQTAGSIIRPASFCGVYGFKPSFGAIDRTGVLKTNDTLDTIGFLSADIYGLKKALYTTLQKGNDYPYSLNYFTSFDKFKLKPRTDLTIGFIGDSLNVFKSFSHYVKEDFETVIKLLSKEYNLKELSGIDFLDEVHDLHEQIYSKSLSYYFTNEMQNHNAVSNVMRDMVSRGEKISTSSYLEAIQKQPRLRERFDRVFKDYDFLIVPSTATYAPQLLEVETADTCLVWTFLGYPTINIPLFISKELNLPYGLQVIGKKFHDFSLLQFSDELQRRFN
jgi:Asp-tRNA(Asn)/Glu-tRNA(Gln) amidotransferase A subunit family amidase